MPIKKDNAGMKPVVKKNQILFIAVLAVILIVCNIFASGRFLRPDNLILIIAHSTFYMFVSWGMVFIFTPGITDLSIGANIILAANLGAICAMDLGWGYAGLILVTILSSMLMEVLSVLCTIKLKIPSWIAGLGMALIYEAILNIYANERAKTEGSNVVTLTEYKIFGNVPVMIACMIVGFILVYLLYNKTSIGFHIEAVGDNRKVASAMGINWKKTILTGALVGGFFVGVGALIQLSYTGKFYPKTGMGSINTIFRSLAILLLGKSLSKLFTTPVSIAICSFLILALFNFLTMIGVPSGTGQEMCLGALVIICGIISSWKSKEEVK